MGNIFLLYFFTQTPSLLQATLALLEPRDDFKAILIIR